MSLAVVDLKIQGAAGSCARRLLKRNTKYKNMKNYLATIVIASALTVSVVIIRQRAQAQNPSPRPADKPGSTIADAAEAKSNPAESTPIFVTEIPPGYRDWRLISVAREEGTLDDIRAVLGNDI